MIVFAVDPCSSERKWTGLACLRDGRPCPIPALREGALGHDLHGLAERGVGRIAGGSTLHPYIMRAMFEAAFDGTPFEQRRLGVERPFVPDGVRQGAKLGAALDLAIESGRWLGVGGQFCAAGVNPTAQEWRFGPFGVLQGLVRAGPAKRSKRCKAAAVELARARFGLDLTDDEADALGIGLWIVGLEEAGAGLADMLAAVGDAL